MTTKSDFTTEEWATLRQAPANAATYVITADPSILGTFQELRALSKALREPRVPPAAQELVGSLVADVADSEQTGAQAAATGDEEGGDVREQLHQSVQEAAALVDAKTSPEEAAGFKKWLLELAEVAAKAHKEGGVLGIGGVRVSDKEKTALAEIKSALGL